MHGFGRFDITARFHSPHYVVFCPLVFQLDIRCMDKGRVFSQTDESGSGHGQYLTDHSKVGFLFLSYISLLLPVNSTV